MFREPAVEACNAGWARYSLLMSFITLGTLAFLLIGGTLGDIFGRKRLLLAGLAALSLANLLGMLSAEPAWFLTTRLISNIKWRIDHTALADNAVSRIQPRFLGAHNGDCDLYQCHEHSRSQRRLAWRVNVLTG